MTTLFRKEIPYFKPFLKLKIVSCAPDRIGIISKEFPILNPKSHNKTSQSNFEKILLCFCLRFSSNKSRRVRYST